VWRLLPVEKTTRSGRIGVATADEDGGCHLGDSERSGELRLGLGRAVGEGPGAFVHVQPSYGDGRTESGLHTRPKAPARIAVSAIRD
jgi:hypothetical protein